MAASSSWREPAPPDERVIDRPPKCWRCGRALGEYAARPWSIKCRRCNAENRSKP